MICRRKHSRWQSEPNPEVRQLPEFLDCGRCYEIPTMETCRPGSAQCQQVLLTITSTISSTSNTNTTTTNSIKACLLILGYLSYLFICYSVALGHRKVGVREIMIPHNLMHIQNLKKKWNPSKLHFFPISICLQCIKCPKSWYKRQKPT